MSGTVYVKGLDELKKFLDELPAKIEANVLRAALRAGANVVAEEARRRAPVGPANAKNLRLYGGYTGALRDSIRVSTRLVGGGLVTAKVSVGSWTTRGADPYYARWVEFGTSPHVIHATAAKSLFYAGHNLEWVMHPGAKPHPFFRVALDATATAALLAVGEFVKRRLSTKYGLDTADIVVQSDPS